MSREGTFEYQRDVYARMLIDLLVIKRETFNVSSNELSVFECAALINSYFHGKVNHHWFDILVDEYPELFSFTQNGPSRKFKVDPIVAYEMDL